MRMLFCYLDCNFNNLALIVLDLSGFSFLGVGLLCFPCVAVSSEYFSGNLLSDIVLINRDIWRGISAA